VIYSIVRALCTRPEGVIIESSTPLTQASIRKIPQVRHLLEIRNIEVILRSLEEHELDYWVNRSIKLPVKE
jgi:hypothetical protein